MFIKSSSSYLFPHPTQLQLQTCFKVDLGFMVQHFCHKNINKISDLVRCNKVDTCLVGKKMAARMMSPYRDLNQLSLRELISRKHSSPLQ